MAGSVAELLGGASTPSADAGPPAPPLGFVVQQTSAPPPPPGFVAQGAAPKDSGLLANVAQGFVNEGIQNSGEMIRDALLNPRALYDRIAGMADQVVGGHAANGPQSPMGLAALAADTVARKQSNSVVAATPAERIGRMAAAGAAGGVINPESVGATVAQLLFGGASGAGSGALAEVAPDNLKPAAAMLGGAIAPAAGHLAHPLAKALAPFVAPVSQGAAEAAAGAKLSAAATDPAAAAAALERPGEIVPGSEPTTYQQTGDPGLGQLERQAATADPAAFQQRAAEQNSARRTALGGVEQGGDPNDVAKALKQQFDDLNTEHDGRVQAATQAAQEHASSALGSEAHPDAIGAQLRAAVSDAHDSAKAHWNSLFRAVDPDESLTANAVATAEAGSSIPAQMPPTAKPLSGEAAAVFDAAANLAPITPLRDIIALRSRVSDAMAEAKMAGELQDHRLLTQLRGAIEENLSNTIAHQVAVDDTFVQRGILKPEEALGARLKAEVDGWQQDRTEAWATVSGGDPRNSRGGTGGIRSPSGAQGESLGRPGNAAGNPRVSWASRLADPAIWEPGYKAVNVGHTQVELAAHPDGVEVITLKTPPQFRGQGSARAAMEQLLAEADRRGQRLMLTPDPMDGATSKTKLTAFYKSLGFESNSGRSRDFSTRHTMIRAPREAPPAPVEPVVANPLQPTIDEAAKARLDTASGAYKAGQQTFGKGPVGEVLKTFGRKDDFRLPNGAVAGKFFHPGPTAFDHMQGLLATGAKDALPTIERYAATTLRRAALKADGTLDPAKYATWRKSFADALRALPEDARAKFSDAARASEALADVQAERAEAVRAAQSGAIGKIMDLTEPEDVVKAVGKVLNSSTPIADMKALARATAGDPVARQGLRRAITDYIASKFVGNTEAGTSGEAKIKADAYQTFVRQNRSALHLVFSPDEVRSMEAVAEDLQRAARSQNTKLPGGSNTAQDINPQLKALGQAAQKSWLEILGGTLGATHGPLGAAAGILGAHLIRSLRAAGISRIDNLVSEAMLDPKLARELLKKAPANTAHWSAAAAPLTAALWSANQTKKDQP